MDIQVVKEIRGAIKQGDLERVQSLIQADRSRLLMSTPFGSWLHVAASQGHLPIVKWLVEEGAELNARGGILGGNALNEAVSEGHLEIVRWLLENHAQMDVDEPEHNPLFSAIQGGYSDIARMLIDSGIDTRVRYSGENMKDMDAAAYAREWGRAEIAEMLNKT